MFGEGMMPSPNITKCHSNLSARSRQPSARLCGCCTRFRRGAPDQSFFSLPTACLVLIPAASELPRSPALVRALVRKEMQRIQTSVRPDATRVYNSLLGNGAWRESFLFNSGSTTLWNSEHKLEVYCSFRQPPNPTPVPRPHDVIARRLSSLLA